MEREALVRKRAALYRLYMAGFDVRLKVRNVTEAGVEPELAWKYRTRPELGELFDWPTFVCRAVDFCLIQQLLPLTTTMFSEQELVGLQKNFEDLYEGLKIQGVTKYYEGEWFDVRVSEPFCYSSPIPRCLTDDWQAIPGCRLVTLVEALMFVAEHGDTALRSEGKDGSAELAVALPNVEVEFHPDPKRPEYSSRFPVFLRRSKPNKEGNRSWKLELMLKGIKFDGPMVALYTYD
ncbi:MAG: hypothetical protein WCJ29_03925 [bacterium]